MLQSADWIVLAVYGLGFLAAGIWLFLRSGKDPDSYFLAGRRLPWWKIGFSSAATYTGAAAAPLFTMLVYQNGIAGNWWWWLSFCLWMPLVAALWSKFWQRLGVSTTAEFMEVRYGGREARLFRGIYAVYMALGWTSILNGYALSMLIRAAGPVFGPLPPALLALAAGILLVYCTVPGLTGIAVTNAAQFIIFIAANGVLALVVFGRSGGWGSIMEAALAQRGEEFFRPLPPSGEIAGMTIVFLLVQGIFFASSPAGGEGYTAQRFMAARNEFHAQAGQMFSAVLTLVVRVVPFIFLGIAGAALLPAAGTDPARVWGILISRLHAPGLTGLLLAGELAAFLSTVETQVNWGSSFIIHDLYRPYVKKNASDRHYAAAGRIASGLVLVLGMFFGYFYVSEVMAWFLFINSVAVAFILPLSWLRFFWWRHNVYGEAAGLLIGLPLSYAVWFPLGFSDSARHPFWHGFLLLFGLGWLVIVVADLLTPPERIETLREFHARCRPPGLWRAVTTGLDREARTKIHKENRQSILDGIWGIIFCLSGVAALTALLGRRTSVFIVGAGLVVVSGAMLYRGHNTNFRNK